MADITSLNLLLCLLLLLLFSLSSTASASHNVVRGVCKASRFPSICVSSLKQAHVPANATVLQAIQYALKVTAENLETGRGLIVQVQRDSTHNANWTNAADSCLESIQYSEYRLHLVASALAEKVETKDARAWLSAVLGYQYNCYSGLRYVGANATKSGAKATEFFNSTLIPISSSALGMVFSYDIYGNKTRKWTQPKTERDGFWEALTTLHSSWPGWAMRVKQLKANVTVCKRGCSYDTVQRAVNATPNNLGHGQMFVILIKAGVYKETVRVPLEKKNVVFLGDGIGKTKITGSRSVGLDTGMTTYKSATVGVVGDGFIACDLSIENTAGANAHQAVAFRSESDKSLVQNCEFIGNQDTLNAVSLRQLYKSCLIRGNIDFIFGNAAAVFQNCTILVAERVLDPEKGSKNAVTAHGRTDPGQSTGFVFLNSVVSGTEAYMQYYRRKPSIYENYLGRPWKEYSRTVFINCRMDALISPEGWMPWQGDFALKTLYYGEFNNTGLGSNLSKRVNWSSLIEPDHVDTYSPPNFIQAY